MVSHPRVPISALNELLAFCALASSSITWVSATHLTTEFLQG